MTDHEWRSLMKYARLQSLAIGERIRVVGIRLSPRLARLIGCEWAYVITVPAGRR